MARPGFFCVILSPAKDLARQRVCFCTNIWLCKTLTLARSASQNSQMKGNDMKRINRMKNGLMLAALSLAILGVTGCASSSRPRPHQRPRPEEIRTSLEFGGVLVSIYHPDTRTMYLWSGDPRADRQAPDDLHRNSSGRDPQRHSHGRPL